MDDRADPDQVLRRRNGCPTTARTSTPILIMKGDPDGHPDCRAGRAQAAAASASATSQDQDEVIMEFPENDQLMFWAEVTDDDRYLVVSIVEGTENKNRLWVYPIISGRAQRARRARSRSSTKSVAEFVLGRLRGRRRSTFEPIWMPRRGRLVSCRSWMPSSTVEQVCLATR